MIITCKTGHIFVLQNNLELNSNLHIIDGDVMTEVNFCCVLCVICIPVGFFLHNLCKDCFHDIFF